MKIKRLVLEIIIVSGLAVSAQAGYGDLKDAYEFYEPTPYYESQLRTDVKPATSAPDESFTQDAGTLSTKQFQWRQKGRGQMARKVTGDLDADRMTALKPSAADPLAAAALLRDRYDLETLTLMVILRNPSIAAGEKNYRAAIEKISQVVELDMILKQYSAFSEGITTGVGSILGKDPVNMKFPFPGVTALKAQIAQKEIEIAELELEKIIRNEIAAAKKSYWNLLYMKQAQAITRETLTLLVHLEEAATTRYEAGKTSYQDVIKIRINRETLEENLVTLREREINVEIAMLAGLNLPAHVVLGTPKRPAFDAPLPDINVLYDQAQNHRQEIHQVRANIGKMERMLEMAETMILPPLTLNLSLYRDEAVMQVGTFNKMDTFPDATAASRGAGLPKNSWYGSDDAYMRQIRQKIEALKDEGKSVKDNTMRMVREAWFDLDRAKREESLYAETIVDLSQTSLEVSTRGYESGQVMFADVFASYDSWFKARLELERKRSDVGVFWAELEKTVGKHLN